MNGCQGDGLLSVGPQTGTKNSQLALVVLSQYCKQAGATKS